jgi:hypothetical protein
MTNRLATLYENGQAWSTPDSAPGHVQPAGPQFVRVIQAEQRAMDGGGVSDPSIGLYSNKSASKANR